MDYATLFAMPNQYILESGIRPLTKEIQQQFWLYYISRHLFTPDYNLVAQKYFNLVAPKLVLEKRFQETDLDNYNPNLILSCNAFIPTAYFKRLFKLFHNPDMALYSFPTLAVMNTGIATGNCPNYMIYDNFKLVKGAESIRIKIFQDDLTLIRDYDIERPIIENQLTHIQLNLKSKNLQVDYVSNECTVYPECLVQKDRLPAIFDTVYLTDYLLKYIYNILVKMLVYERTAEDTKCQTFLIGSREVVGHYRVSNITEHAGFRKLINTVRLFILKNKLKGNKDIQSSYAKYLETIDTELSVYMNYETIKYSSTPVEDTIDNKEWVFQFQPFEVQPVLTYRVAGNYQELPIFAQYFRRFLVEHYVDIKVAFPIYERLENIYRLCSMVCLIKQLATTTSLGDFITTQTYIETTKCYYVDTFASSILCSGGINILPREFVRVPHVSLPKITPTVKHIDQGTNGIFVIRRGLGNAPIKTGAVAHSGLLQTYNGKTYLLEYGPKGVSQREIHVQDIEKLAKFEVAGEKWSKQMVGETANIEYTPEQLKRIMTNLTTARGDYHVHHNNCHMAQEDTRKAIGLQVREPYKPLW